MMHRPRPARRGHTPLTPVLGGIFAVLLLTLTACTEIGDGPGGGDPVVVDPALMIVAPSDGDVVSEPDLVVEGSVDHPDGPPTVTASLAERTVGCSVTGTDFACDIAPLAEGENVVTVTARASDGGETSATVTVTYEPSTSDEIAPTLEIEAPENDAVVSEDSVVVQGTVSHPEGIDRVEATLDADTTACSTSGNAFACDVALSVAGTNSIAITAFGVDGGSTTEIVRVEYRPSDSEPEGAFVLDLVFYDHEFEPHHVEAIRDAARRWEEIVVGDLQDVPVDFDEDEACFGVFPTPAFSGVIDDVQVYVTTRSFESDLILGAAGPCRVRSGGDDPWTTFVGAVELNVTRIEELHANGTLVPTMVHELGHVLGFGTQWETTLPIPDLIEYEASDGASACRDATGFASPPVYVGTHGMQAYEALSGSGPVPVEDTGGPGTQCGHWDEDTFGNELMTGFLNAGSNPLSGLSVAAIRDLGFEVDPGAADPYDLPDPLALHDHDHDHGLDIASQEILYGPFGGIDMETGEFVPLDEVRPARHGPAGPGEHDDHDHAH